MACEHLNASGGGRKMSLDIPFNRTLMVWKKGASFDSQHLKQQAA
jgi:hypothetical protein